MKFSRLNLNMAGVTTGFALLLLTACNNSDKSGNNSTTETDTGTVVTTGTTTDTSKVMTTAPGKKIGKATIKPAAIDKTAAMKTDGKGYYNYTETAPEFAGGQVSLESYINNNIGYPQDAIDNDMEGTVYVMFTIDENGKVGNAKTTGTAIGYGLEEEAVKVVNGMTNWTPGTNKGKKVKAWYTLPIAYKLE